MPLEKKYHLAYHRGVNLRAVLFEFERLLGALLQFEPELVLFVGTLVALVVNWGHDIGDNLEGWTLRHVDITAQALRPQLFVVLVNARLLRHV